MQIDAPIRDIDAPLTKTTRMPFVAFLFSLFATGLGQIYNGQLGKGITLFCLQYGIIIFAAFSDAMHLLEGLIVIIIVKVGLRLYAVIDASIVAHKKRYAPWASYNKWYLHLCLFIVMAGITIIFPLTSVVGIESFSIPTTSKVPTLLVGDRIIADMRCYYDTLPQYGDLIVYQPNHDPTTLFISRVMGLPGDQIQIVHRQFYVNGKPISQTTIANTTVPAYEFYGEDVPSIHGILLDSVKIETVEESLPNGKTITVQYNHRAGYGRELQLMTVPEGTYFVTGDNRDNSLDSRFDSFGTIPMESIEGKGLYIFWAKDKSRIGKRLE